MVQVVGEYSGQDLRILGMGTWGESERNKVRLTFAEGAQSLLRLAKRRRLLPLVRTTAIPPLTSRWRECSGKVRAAGAVCWAGEAKGDPGLKQGVLYYRQTFTDRCPGSGLLACLLPWQTVKASFYTCPTTFRISQRPSVQVYTSLKGI